MTYIDSLEEVSEIVANWAANIVDTTIDSLAPDGRPFGMQELTENEQIAQYMTLRGDSEAWSTWITDRDKSITDRLTSQGIDEEQIAEVQPFDIVESFAIDYSSRMEKLIGKQNA